jgi:recombinational DNA repair protein (RecF pathway)
LVLVKTEAIVLKSDNYREKSKILTLYTKSHGKLRVIAKGVRDTKSKWGGVLESMAYLNVIIYFHENKTMHLLSIAEYVSPFQNLFKEFDKMKTGFRIVEMVNRTTMENQVISGLFDLLVSALTFLNSATNNFINVLFYFEFKLAELLGIAFSSDTYYLNPASSAGVKLKGKELEIIRTIAQTNLDDIVKIELTGVTKRLIDGFLDEYFREHFEGIRYSKTKKVFNSREFYV